VSYDRVLLDLDGTVYLGHGAVPGAAEAIAELRAAGVRLAFVTNDPVSARAEYVERLGAIGIAVGADELVTCAWATAQLVAEERPGARVLALGSQAWLDEHRLAGAELVDDYRAAEVLSLGGDWTFGYRELEASIRAVLRGAAFYGSNRDATFPNVDGPSPGAGALLAAVEYATGVPARCAGKPEIGMFHEAERLLGPGRYLMVGDRLDADVAGAHAAGMDAALVLTGSSTADQAAAWQGAAPAAVLGSIAELPAFALGAPTCSGT
jgi:HAD superfamily hydrolase (TIGR01450 family)